jgi:hypothetical protein
VSRFQALIVSTANTICASSSGANTASAVCQTSSGTWVSAISVIASQSSSAARSPRL